jgi:hypothetical protein
MENIREWFGQNYQWILSGVGIALLSALFRVMVWLINQRAKKHLAQEKDLAILLKTEVSS